MTDRMARLGLVLTIVGALLPWVSVPPGFDRSIIAFGKGDSYSIVLFGSIVLLLHFIPRVSVSTRYIGAMSIGLPVTLITFADTRVIRFVASDNSTQNVHTGVGIWFCLIGGVITTFAGLMSRHATRSG